MGTRTYASPEQILGLEFDEKSDIFSLGVIAFELYSHFTTGQRSKIDRLWC